MLLPRLVARLRNQEWGTLLIELAVVVVGVFIGIQAANWNEDRLERERGVLITQRLIADLQKDLKSRNILVHYYETVFDSAERTIARLNSDSIDDPSAFVFDAYRTTEYAHRPATRAAFDEIISTGSLGLIPVDARQAGVIEYFRYDHSSAMREAVRASPYRHRVRRLIPYDVQAALRANCSDVFNERFEIVGFKKVCDLKLPPERIEHAATALLGDQDLLADLRLHFSVLSAQMPQFRGEVVNLEATVKALQEAGR